MLKRPHGTISLSEAGRRLGLQHHKDVHLLHQHGEIRAYRVGAMWCIDERSVEDYRLRQVQKAS